MCSHRATSWSGVSMREKTEKHLIFSLNPTYWVESKLEGCSHEIINPSNPNIQMEIFQTGLFTFPSRIRWRNLLKDQSIFLLVIILLNLINFSLDEVVRLLGENWWWSCLGLLITFLWVISALAVLRDWMQNDRASWDSPSNVSFCIETKRISRGQ